MKKLLPVIFALLMLWGCSRKPSAPPGPENKVVTSISVFYENGPISTSRFYNSDPKMRAILSYLRWIDPSPYPQGDPETASGSIIRLTVRYSDGTQRLFTQKAERYLRVDDGSWQAIDTGKAKALGRILGKMSSDESLSQP